MSLETEQKLKKLWMEGDLTSFRSLYKASRQLNAETHFLATLAFHDMLEWHELEISLTLLSQSPDESVRLKTRFKRDILEFLMLKQSVKAGEQLIANCNGVIEKNIDDGITFFAQALRLRVKVALISLGIADAFGKPALINEGIALMEAKASQHPKEAFELLIFLMNLTLGHPLSNPQKCIELYEKGKSLFINRPCQFQWLTCFALEMEAELRLNFHKRENCDVDQLPAFVMKQLESEKIEGHICAKAMMASIYGIHLLRLDFTEGIKWVTRSLPILWKYGHIKIVKRLKDECINWAEVRSQVKLAKELIERWRHIKPPRESPFDSTLENLNLSHQYFSRGNFYQGKKVIEEQLARVESETNRQSLLALLVNNAARLQVDKKGLIDLIEEQIRKWLVVKHSFLIAQAYEFRAILQPSKSVHFFSESVRAFQELAMYEEAIGQIINVLSAEITLKIQREQPVEVSAQVQNLIVDAEAIIAGNSMLKSPLTLLANMYQAVGQALFLAKQDHKALEFLDQASEAYGQSQNLYGKAMTANYQVLLLTRLAKAARSLKQYDRAVALGKEALEVFREAGLFDFEWRMAWHLALALGEPINFGLVAAKDRRARYLEAKQFYYAAELMSSRIFGNTRHMDRSEMLLASIELNKDKRQMMFSGFYLMLFQNDLTASLEWLEKVRSRAHTASLNYGLELSIDHELLKEEQDLIQQFDNVLSYDEILNLEQQKKLVYQQMQSVPELMSYALLRSSQINLFDEVVTRLKAKDAQSSRHNFFLYYYTHGSEIYAFGISAEDPAPLVKKIELKADLMSQAIQVGFEAILSKEDYSKENESVWTDFSQLIDPLATWTKPGDIISIIPYGYLQGLPFHCLLLEGNPLICRNPVSYNFSLLSWVFLTGTAQALTFNKVAVFGDSTEHLEQSAAEAKEVALYFETEAKTGREITKALFLKSFVDASMVHFAGHGDFKQQGTGFNTSVVELMEDYVTAKEIIDLDAKAQIVVLSACDTARHIRHEGDEYIGLVSSLLSSGVKTVMAGLWKLLDEDAKEFFDLFYPKIIDGMPPVIAMQESMIQLIETKDNFYQWGGLALYGHF